MKVDLRAEWVMTTKQLDADPQVCRSMHGLVAATRRSTACDGRKYGSTSTRVVAVQNTVVWWPMKNTPFAGSGFGAGASVSHRASRSGPSNGAHARERSSPAESPREIAATASAISGHCAAFTGRSKPRVPLRT